MNGHLKGDVSIYNVYYNITIGVFPLLVFIIFISLDFVLQPSNG
jgi:hypothetical protein